MSTRQLDEAIHAVFMTGSAGMREKIATEIWLPARRFAIPLCSIPREQTASNEANGLETVCPGQT